MYSWDETADSIALPLSAQAQRWFAHFECLKWHREHFDSFHVAGAVLESVHKSDQINSRQFLPEVSVTNRFLIWFEWDKNSWIKSAWRNKKEKASLFLVCVCFVPLREYGKWFVFFWLWSVPSLTKIKQTFLPKINLALWLKCNNLYYYLSYLNSPMHSAQCSVTNSRWGAIGTPVSRLCVCLDYEEIKESTWRNMQTLQKGPNWSRTQNFP